MSEMTDEELAELIALRKAQLAELYAIKKARRLAARNVVPRAVKVARTLERNLEIRRLRREDKLTYRELSARFGLSARTLPHIVAHLDYEDRMRPLREEWHRGREAAQ